MGKKLTYWVLGIAITGIAIYYLTKDRLSKNQRQVVFQANTEADKWLNYNENSPEIGSIINQYWCEGVGMCNFSDSQVISQGFNDEYPWSAAFISWVMKSTGSDSFPTNASHSNYVIETTINREVNEDDEFTAWDINEQRPMPSDIVCKRRLDSTATYGNVPSGTPLHCDIVTSVSKNSIEVIGGNINNKVERKTISLNQDGFVNESKYFVIIKNKT
mgnify:CR=1 FL=1